MNKFAYFTSIKAFEEVERDLKTKINTIIRQPTYTNFYFNKRRFRKLQRSLRHNELLLKKMITQH